MWSPALAHYPSKPPPPHLTCSWKPSQTTMSLCGYQGGAQIPQGTALMPLAGWHSFLLIRPCHGQPRSQTDQPFRPRLPGFGHLLPGHTFLPTPTQRFLLASCLGAPPPRSLPSLRVSLPPVPRRNCFGALFAVLEPLTPGLFPAGDLVSEALSISWGSLGPPFVPAR